MKDLKKTNEQLSNEVKLLKTKIAKLEKDKEKFKIVTDNTSDSIAITTFDLKAKYLYVSPSVKNILGFEASELIGKSFFSFIHPDDKKLLFPLLKKYIKQIFSKTLRIDAPYLSETIEYRFKNKAGNWHYLQSTLNLIGKDMLSITRDITERKLADEALKERTNFLDKIIESSAISMWISDDKGTAIRTNPACLKFFCATEAEVIGKYNLFKDEVLIKQGLIPQIKKVFNKGEVANIIIDYNFNEAGHVEVKNATQKIVNSIFTPVIDSSGKVSNVIVQAIDLTEMHLKEKNLRESEEKFRGFIESSDDLVIRLTRTGYIDYVSPRVEFLYGYKPDELIGKHFRKTTPLRDIPKSIKALQTVFNGEALKNFEINQIRKNGQVIPMEINAIPVVEDKQIIAFQGVMRDISERKKAEVELKRSESRFKSLYESLGDAVFVTKMGGKGVGQIIEVNPAAIKQTGYSRDELLRMNILDDIYVSGSSDLNSNDWENIIQKGKIITVTEKKRRKDGTEFWTEVIVTPVDHNGEKAALSINHDITGRVEIVNKLNKEIKFNQTLLQATPGFYVAINAEGKIVMLNETFLNVLGYRQEEIIGKDYLTTIVPERDRASLSVIFENLVHLNKPTLNENLVQTKDGKELLVEWHGKPIFNEHGEFDYFFGFGLDITEQKKAQVMLKNIFDNTQDAILIHDLKGNIIDVNGKMCSMYGLSKEEACVASIEDISSPETPMDRVKSLWEKVLNLEKQLFEWKARRPHDGFVFDVEVSLQRLQSVDQDYILANVRDISDRKRTEVKLIESRKRFKALHNASFGGIAIHDKGIILDCNQGLSKLTGYTIEELIGVNGIQLLIAENSRKTVVEIIKNDFEKPYEVFGRRKNGDEYPLRLEARIIPFRGKQMRVVEFRDISEAKRAEKIQKVLYNISFAVNLTENLDELIAVIRKELGTLMDTTNFFVATYEEETDTILLPYIADQKDTHTSFPAGKTYTAQVIKTKKSILIGQKDIAEFESDGKAETVGTVSKIWLGVPMIIDGTVKGAIVVQSYEDENAYTHKDMEILEFVSNTVGISIERKRAEQNLKQALEKATESDRLKSAFLATMSHELRTPLNAVIGFSDLINEDLPTEDIINFSKTINSSGNHLLNIVNDLFDITLIEAGQTKFDKRTENLHEILKEVDEIVKTEQQNINKTNLDLKLIIPQQEGNLNINTDPSKLKQILINLLKNALKFTNEGHVQYGYSIEKNNNRIEFKFYVEDTGIGVPENKKELIFDIFRQAQESYTKTYGGTGIGLTISKKLVELLGGKIWLESKEENLANGQRGGTTFYFTIPISGDFVDKKPVNKKGKANAENNLKGRTVLIVEDVEASYEYLKIVIEKLELNTLWALNGEEAIALCKENKSIDLILMDINMPIMNGYEATKQIKKFKPDLPIIAQTAYAIAGDEQKALDAGCDDYISKPIKKQELIAKIEKLLDS